MKRLYGLLSKKKEPKQRTLEAKTLKTKYKTHIYKGATRKQRIINNHLENVEEDKDSNN